MAPILIIEDERVIRRMMREMLEPTGHEVREASDGVAGLSSFRDQPVDLIIMDILMPERDGIETILALKRESPDVKIVAISGGGDAGRIDYLEQARDLGADRTLHKPFTKPQLLEIVEDLIN